MISEIDIINKLKKANISIYKIIKICGQKSIIEYICPYCSSIQIKKYTDISARKCSLCPKKKISKEKIISDSIMFGFKNPIIKDYNGVKTRVYYTCSQCNSSQSCTFSEMKYRTKNTCKKCLDNNLKKDINSISSALSLHGCIFKERIGKKIYFICKCGNTSYILLSDINKTKNITCRECHITYLKNNNIQHEIEDKKTKVICCKCKKFYYLKSKQIFNIKDEHICGVCKIKEKYFNSFNLHTDDEYKNSKTKIKIQCKCGKYFYRILNTIQQSGNTRCQRCTKKINNIENDLAKYIDELQVNYSQQNRSIIKKELDIYFPDHQLAIEINGAYWHSEQFLSKYYHLDKTKKCYNLGINLLHFFDFEWKNKREICKSIIKNKLKLTEKKIFARKCVIKPVGINDKNNFLNNNHLQGKDRSNIKYGLYYQNELVFIMTFVKPRFNHNYEWEISRVCTKINTIVVGGFSKIFKFFVNQHQPKTVLTYADLRYSTGQAYIANNFILDNISKPSYFYFKGDIIISRYKAQKKNLQKILKIFDPNLSEVSNMHNNEYYRVWDCGNLVFTWRKNEDDIE